MKIAICEFRNEVGITIKSKEISSHAAWNTELCNWLITSNSIKIALWLVASTSISLCELVQVH